MSAASSGMSPAAALSHRLSGLAGIQFIKKLDDQMDDVSAQKIFAEKLQTIHEKIMAAPRQFLLVSEADVNAQLQQDIEAIWPQQSAAGSFKALSPAPVQQQIKQAWLTSTQVNFCAKAYVTVASQHADAAPLNVLGGFMRNGFLHRAIREQGGAYGGGAGNDSANACFRFYSYRDPRLAETLHDFDAAIEWMLSSKHTEQQLEEAILGVISGIDKPGSPAGEAKQAFHNELYGRTAAQRRESRARILQVSLKDLTRVTEQYLHQKPASVAVITSANKEAAVKDLQLEIKQL